MQITITQKDIEKKNICSSSGQVIDALAFSANKWDSNDLWENNVDYEPNEPYDFNYEEDLFKYTKTQNDLKDIGTYLDCGVTLNSETKLQAGAYMAFKNPQQWEELVEAYKDKLKFERTDGPSKEYNKELQEYIDSQHEDLYNEWLNGDRSSMGVVYDISKFFTDTCDGFYDEKKDEYTFEIENPHELFCNCYEDNCKDYKTKKSVKERLLNDIKSSSDAVVWSNMQKAAERKEKWEKEKAFREERAKRDAEEREKKLLSMTL